MQELDASSLKSISGEYVERPMSSSGVQPTDDDGSISKFFVDLFSYKNVVLLILTFKFVNSICVKIKKCFINLYLQLHKYKKPSKA